MVYVSSSCWYRTKKFCNLKENWKFWQRVLLVETFLINIILYFAWKLKMVAAFLGFGNKLNWFLIRHKYCISDSDYSIKGADSKIKSPFTSFAFSIFFCFWQTIQQKVEKDVNVSLLCPFDWLRVKKSTESSCQKFFVNRNSIL